MMAGRHELEKREMNLCICRIFFVFMIQMLRFQLFSFLLWCWQRPDVKVYSCHIWEKCCKFVTLNETTMSEPVQVSVNALPIQASPFSDSLPLTLCACLLTSNVKYPASSQTPEVQIHEPRALTQQTSKASICNFAQCYLCDASEIQSSEQRDTQHPGGNAAKTKIYVMASL